MDYLVKVKINLSATIGGGRCSCTYKSYKVQKETPKTVIVNSRGGSHRYQKSEMLKAQADFKNQMLSRLQFYTTCDIEEVDKAVEVLKEAMKATVLEITAIHNKALVAFTDGFTLEQE